MAHIGLIGEPSGFSHIGGINTLKNLLEAELSHRGDTTSVIKADTAIPEHTATLVVIGCSSPWAYRTAIEARLRKLSVTWIPCFHPPTHVRNKIKARMAGKALRLSQRIGIDVFTLSIAEKHHLDAGRCSVISLPFSIESNQPWTAETTWGYSDEHPRPFSVVYLGRPVAQKGWPQFLDLIERTRLPALAIVPTEPEGKRPQNLTLRISIKDCQVQQELRQASALFLPADYESFGFAQAEALRAGCCVPVIGEWPLWLDVAELDWRGFSPEEQAESLQRLMTNPGALRRLHEQQVSAWRLRPERMAPILPLFTKVTTPP